MVAPLSDLIRAFQFNCRFLPALGEVCEDGLQGGLCGPFGQVSTPQRALTALLWICAHTVRQVDETPRTANPAGAAGSTTAGLEALTSPAFDKGR